VTSALLTRGGLPLLRRAGFQVHPAGRGRRALADAVAAWRADRYAGLGMLKDLSGNRHHLRLGTVSRAQIVDGALELPGATGSFASTPHTAALAVTGAVQLDVDAHLNSWHGAFQTLISKRDGAVGEYLLYVNTTGFLEFLWYEAGVLRSAASPQLAAAAGRLRVRVTRTFSGSTATVQFSTSTDGVTWTAFGVPRSVVTAGGPATATTLPLTVGAQSATSSPANGRIFSAEVRNGVDGPVVARFDPSALPDHTPSWVDPHGNRWRILPGFAQVHGGVLHLPGADHNFAVTADAAALRVTGALQIDVDVHLPSWATGASQLLVSKRSAASNVGEYALYVTGTGFLEFFWHEAGTVRLAQVGPFPAAAARRHIRVTRTFGPTSATVQFFTSDDGTTWTQFGPTRTVVTGGGLATPTDVPVRIGAQVGSPTMTNGLFYSATIRNGIDGPVVATFDPSGQPNGASSWVGPQGSVWMVSRTLPDADTNDPLFLPHAGEQYLHLPGVVGNHATTPSSPAVRVTGALQIDVDLGHPTWRPAVVGMLVAKRSGAVGEYAFRLNTTGALELFWYEAGTLRLVVSTAPVTPAAGAARKRLRVTRTFGPTSATVRFFTSDDGVTWTQLGDDRVVVTAGGDATATDLVLCVGADSGAAQPTEGSVYSAEVRNGVGGPVAARFNAARAAEPFASVSSTTGETWTIARSATGRKAALVDRPMFLLGTDDFLQTPDHPNLNFGAGDQFTVLAAYRMHSPVPSTGNSVIAKKAGTAATDPGWALQQMPAVNASTARLHHADGASRIFPDSSGSLPFGTVVLAVGRVDASTGEAAIGTTFGTPLARISGSAVNTLPVRVGNFAGAYADMVFLGAAIFRRALTDAELAAVARELGVAA
jgi:hypothetical protein